MDRPDIHFLDMVNKVKIAMDCCRTHCTHFVIFLFFIFPVWCGLEGGTGLEISTSFLSLMMLINFDSFRQLIVHVKRMDGWKMDSARRWK